MEVNSFFLKTAHTLGYRVGQKIQRKSSVEKSGGSGGIRTHDTVTRIHAFQAGAIDHSATDPHKTKVGRNARALGCCQSFPYSSCARFLKAVTILPVALLKSEPISFSKMRERNLKSSAKSMRVPFSVGVNFQWLVRCSKGPFTITTSMLCYSERVTREV